MEDSRTTDEQLAQLQAKLDELQKQHKVAELKAKIAALQPGNSSVDPVGVGHTGNVPALSLEGLSHGGKKVTSASYDTGSGMLKITLEGGGEVEGRLKEISEVVTADFIAGKNMKSESIVSFLMQFVQGLGLQHQAAAALMGLKDKPRVTELIKGRAGAPTNKKALEVAIAKELLQKASANPSVLYTFNGSSHDALTAKANASAKPSSASIPHDVTRTTVWRTVISAAYRAALNHSGDEPVTARLLLKNTLPIFWAALTRPDVARLNDADLRIFNMGLEELGKDERLLVVCKNWISQANSQAARIRGEKRKLSSAHLCTAEPKRTASSANTSMDISTTEQTADPLLQPMTSTSTNNP